MKRCTVPGCPIPDIFPPHRHSGSTWIDSDHAADAMRYAMLAGGTPRRLHWQYGWLFRWGSAWIGGHWSPRNKRLCLNLLPFVTLWITAPGGKTPAEDA